MHDKNHTQISHFLSQEQAKQQQECLQNVFDAQPDGIIILSERLKKKATKKKNDNNFQESSDIDSSSSDLYGDNSYISPSIASFINPTETAGED